MIDKEVNYFLDGSTFSLFTRMITVFELRGEANQQTVPLSGVLGRERWAHAVYAAQLNNKESFIMLIRIYEITNPVWKCNGINGSTMDFEFHFHV